MSQPPIKSLFLEAPPSDLIMSPWQLLAAKETGTCGFKGGHTTPPDNIGDLLVRRKE